VPDEEEPVESSVSDKPSARPDPGRNDDHGDPADRAPSWGPESVPTDRDKTTADAPTADQTREEWDRLLDEADAPPPVRDDPRSHPDVPDSARRLLRDDTAAG
jgi:hypothetical protein